MKTLSNYIKSNKSSLISLSEKLVIIPSQVNEKLIVNKNTKLVSDNEEFYEEFKDYLNIRNHNIDWYHSANVVWALPTSMEPAWINATTDFFAKRSVYVKYAKDMKHYDKLTKLYKDMIEFINDNDVELAYKGYDTNNKFKGDDYFIYLLETEKLKVCIYGWPEVDVENHIGTMIFQYK